MQQCGARQFHQVFSALLRLRQKLLISAGCRVPDGSGHWADLQHVALLPPDPGRDGERLCTPQPSHCPRGQAEAGWLRAAIPCTTPLPHGRDLASPPRPSPCGGKALLRDSLTLMGCPGNSQANCWPVLGWCTYPAHPTVMAASAWLTPAVLPSPLTLLLPTPRQRCLWAPPPQREDSQCWGWVGAGSDKPAVMTTLPPPWRRSVLPSRHDPVPAPPPTRRSGPLRGGHCLGRSSSCESRCQPACHHSWEEKHLPLCGVGDREGESHRWQEDGSGP